MALQPERDPERGVFASDGEGNFDIWGCDVYAEWDTGGVTFATIGDFVLLGEGGIDRLRERELVELHEKINAMDGA